MRRRYRTRVPRLDKARASLAMMTSCDSMIHSVAGVDLAGLGERSVRRVHLGAEAARRIARV